MEEIYVPLDACRIERELSSVGIGVRIYDSIDSTNSEAKRRASLDMRSPVLFIAEEQTGGRGRMGRSFFSPRGTGLYTSLLIPLDGGLSDTVGMTSAAAVAAVRAIRYACGVEARIKWVNDIYLDGRKVAGILAESFALDGHAFAVVGIGINISTREFPEELRDRAGSIRADGCADVRSSLAARFASELWSLVRALPELSFMDEYRASSAVLGREVVFTENGREYTGVAESVDDVGALTVRLSESGTRVLRSGEISLRTV